MELLLSLYFQIIYHLYQHLHSNMELLLCGSAIGAVASLFTFTFQYGATTISTLSSFPTIPSSFTFQYGATTMNEETSKT